MGVPAFPPHKILKILTYFQIAVARQVLRIPISVAPALRFFAVGLFTVGQLAVKKKRIQPN